MAHKLSRGLTAKPHNPMYSVGKVLKQVQFDYTYTAANETAGDTYELASGIGLDDRIVAIRYDSLPASTAAADNDFGFYFYNSAGVLTALDKDVLVDGGSIASAVTQPGDLLALNASLDRTKTVGELLSLNRDREKIGGLILCWTMNTKGTADVAYRWTVVIESATTI